MDGLQYAVEFAHDDNLLGGSPSNVVGSDPINDVSS